MQAIGGKEKLLSVEDVTYTMAATVQGTPISITQQRKTPNKARQVVQAQGMEMMKVTSNGTKAVMSQMGNSQEIGGKQLKDLNLENTLFPELQYQKMGVKAELAGVQSVRWKEA